MRFLIFLVFHLFLVFKTIHTSDEIESDWDWKSGVIPHYSYPHYDDSGEILFFPRIIGGTPAFLGEFTAKVSVQTRRGDHFCGGALIDLRHVLSAAHCLVTPTVDVINPNEIRLMADDLSILSRNPAPSRQIRFATHIFVHPGYDDFTYANDIAIVRVSVPFTQTATLRAVPRSTFTPPDNQACHLAGWGVTHEERVRPHPILLRVGLDIISMNFCNGTSSFNGNIPENFFCAGTLDGSRDACFGDSGGGLICNNQIAGIVSFGFGCGRRNFPGAYVDVSRYNHWIQESIASNLPHDDLPRPTQRPNSVSPMIPLSVNLFIAITFAAMAFSVT